MAQVVVEIVDSIDVSKASRAARLMAQQIGMDKYEAGEIETSVSELATNIFRHACGGRIMIERVGDERRTGIKIVGKDEGPGIEDVAQAMKEGYSSADSLGAGLSGVQRMMDEFIIESELGRGTTVEAVKWRK